MNMIEKSIAGIDMTAFPCENLYHLIENHSFGCHWNRHLLSFVMKIIWYICRNLFFISNKMHRG